jgi:hypothetical protein
MCLAPQSETLAKILALVAKGEVRIAEHGYDELAADDIYVDEVLNGMRAAAAVEDDPDYHQGPSDLVLVRDGRGTPMHVVWGTTKGREAPAGLVNTGHLPTSGPKTI